MAKTTKLPPNPATKQDDILDEMNKLLDHPEKEPTSLEVLNELTKAKLEHLGLLDMQILEHEVNLEGQKKLRESVRAELKGLMIARQQFMPKQPPFPMKVN